ncbi:MAG: hypothetical protein JWM28_2033 [Chitinophagaceae bacterium]|nr:hypothetical protein [Chitinophagaceae bacterium]
MPNTKNQTFRIKIIDDLLTRNKWVKTTRIKEVIESKLIETVSLRTIQKDIDDMKNDTRLGYNAPIIYNKGRGAFCYEDEDYTIKNFSLRPEEITALQFYAECLQAFSGYKLFDSFSSGIKKVIDGVQVRNRIKTSTNPKTILQTDSLITPVGHEYLEILVHAIDDKLKTEITYRQYGSNETQKRILIPLFLKEYRNRWYLLSQRLDNKELRTYALDRIKTVNVTDETLTGGYDFKPDEYFEHSFGITTPDSPIETIVLRFSTAESAYITSLPIHPTQTIVKRTAKYVTISIRVMLSYEVYDFILSKTPEVKVMAPAKVAKAIAEKLKKAADFYKN